MTANTYAPWFSAGYLDPDTHVLTHPGLTLMVGARAEQIAYTAMLAGLYAHAGHDVVVVSSASDLLDDELAPALRQAAGSVEAMVDRVRLVAEDRLTSRGRTAHDSITAAEELDGRIARLSGGRRPVVLLPLSHLIADAHLPQVLHRLLVPGGSVAGGDADLPTLGAYAAPNATRLPVTATARVVVTRQVGAAPSERQLAPSELVAQADLAVDTIRRGASLAPTDLRVRKSRGFVPNDIGFLDV